MQSLKAFSERVMFNLFKTKTSILIAIMCVVVVLSGCGNSEKVCVIGKWKSTEMTINDSAVFTYIFTPESTYSRKCLLDMGRRIYIDSGKYEIHYDKNFYKYAIHLKPYEPPSRKKGLHFVYDKNKKCEYLTEIYSYNPPIIASDTNRLYLVFD